MTRDHDSTDVPVFASALEGVRLLIVDDTPDTLYMLSVLLELNGASVRTAASAGEARDAYLAEAPDLIVSDISMPGESGLELIASIRGIERADGRREVPAIALTGVADNHRERSIEAGFQEHMSKPTDPDRLVRTIVRLLAGG